MIYKYSFQTNKKAWYSTIDIRNKLTSLLGSSTSSPFTTRSFLIKGQCSTNSSQFAGKFSPYFSLKQVIVPDVNKYYLISKVLQLLYLDFFKDGYYESYIHILFLCIKI